MEPGEEPITSDSKFTIDDYIFQSFGEHIDNFAIRRELIKAIYSKTDYDPVSCVVFSHMLMNKAILNATYDDQIEELMTQLLEKL